MATKNNKQKVLILAQEEETTAKFTIKLAQDHNSTCIFKTSNFESFQEGKRVDTYDMVIMWVPEADEGELEMSEEFYKHYCTAPVCMWYTKEGVNDAINTMFKSDFCFHAPTENRKDDLAAIIKTLNDKFQKVLEEDVKPAFNKFDKDGSGAIDKVELGQLSKDLGQELSEEQLTAALRDLDLNGDGVIDIDEFRRWYFTGMKPYNGARRSLLKLGGKASKLLDVVSE